MCVDESLLIQTAMTNGGVLTLHHLTKMGLSRRKIRDLVKSGSLVKIRRNAYVPALVWTTARNDRGRRAALEAAAGLGGVRFTDAVASHTSAALIHGLDLLDSPKWGRVTLTRPPSRTGGSGVGIQIANAEVPDHHRVEKYGLPLTSPARTVIDLCRSRRFDLAAGLVVADSALHRVLADEFDLYEVLNDCRGWPGWHAAERCVRQADPQAATAIESLTRARLIEAGFPLPQCGVILPDAEHLRFADFLWMPQRVVGESDGLRKYDSHPGKIADEKARDEELRRAGYEPVHFLWHEIRRTPQVVIERLRAAFDRTRRLGYW